MLSQEIMLLLLSQESTFSLSQESNDDTEIGNTENVNPNVMPNSGSTTTTKTRRKRAAERTIVELNDNSTVMEDDINVIIPFESFLTFMGNFVCAGCHGSENIRFERLTRGIATSINSKCQCGRKATIQARLRSSSEKYKRLETKGEANLVPTIDYELNMRLMLSIQQVGGGRMDAAVFGGMLNLAVNPCTNAWENIELECSKEEIRLGKEIIGENLSAEIGLTKKQETYPTDDGHIGILVQGDTRWDKRSSGRTYDSESGTAILCGNLTQKCVSLTCMSKRCSYCEAKEKKKKKLRRKEPF
jgi:hypothetical protein